jgi:hypothetical protein
VKWLSKFWRWLVAKKKPEGPSEICVYCEQDVPCCWTVMIGSCGYAMCKECSGEATKDFFSYSMRTEADRKLKDDFTGE